MPGFTRNKALLAEVPCGCKIVYSFSFDNGRTYEIDYCDRHLAGAPVHERVAAIEKRLAYADSPTHKGVEPTVLMPGTITILGGYETMTIEDLLTTLRNPAGKTEDELKEAMFEAADTIQAFRDKVLDLCNSIGRYLGRENP